jgi:prepilin-type N-terminal cleavage/methylation domain-containing protein
MTKTINPANRGDTIVEVLIALTILSLAISITYSIVNSSITAMLSARRATGSTALLQKQVELLRTNDLTAVTGSFCFNNSNQIETNLSNCSINDYNMQINKDANDQYVVTVYWNVGGKNYTATMFYAK